MNSAQDPQMDDSMPVRDHGSFLWHHPSDADIQDHRKQNKIYIGLHLPRQNRLHRRHRHHRHKKASREESRGNQDYYPMVAPPSLRVQCLLGEDEDEDHKTHNVFCELAELLPSAEDPKVKEWKETARWVKFEEDVEEGGERWSKPHVATLSLHFLFELRCSFYRGAVMLDMDATTLEQVIDLMLDNMIASGQLEPAVRDQFQETMLAPHRHQNEKRVKHREESRIHIPFVRSLADMSKKCSDTRTLDDHENIGSKSTPNMTSLHRTCNSPATERETRFTNGLANGGGIHENGLTEVPSYKSTQNSLPGEDLTASPSRSDIRLARTASERRRIVNMHFMKKIPVGSEASNILVGEVDFLNHQVMAFIRLSKAHILGDLTEVPLPTRFIYLLLGPVGNQNKFHEIGRSIATLMTDEIFHDVAYHAHNREDLLTGIDEFLDQVTVLPPGEWDPSIRIEPPKSVPSQENRKTASSAPPQPNGKPVQPVQSEDQGDQTLQRTGRLFGGLRDDVKRKIPFYISDVKDAFHIQCLASFIFLYFACLTPIITFGGLLGDATNNNIAAFESLLSGAICGIVYSLFAGQPLTILGSTGPVLVFETILSHFCVSEELNYLQMRCSIGILTGVILIGMVAADLSALVRYITRFTEESFAALISLIFIYEAFKKLISIAYDYPVNLHPNAVLSYNCSCNLTGLTLGPNISMDTIVEDNCTQFNGTLVGDGCDTPVYHADIFFFSVLLFLGTFTLCYFLKIFRNTSFCSTMMRSTVSDFAVLIAILVMVSVDVLVGLPTPKLNVPDTFSPTNPERGWFVVPFEGLPAWAAFGSILPALLAVILIFMDQQITAVIVNRKENKLMKGSGYHLDLFIVALLIILNSLLGLPWFVAATVLSINHVNSLKKESKCSAPGEQPKFLGVREQRVTGVMIFLFIGVSVTITKILKLIPMPVLYGVFLYMGVSSLGGMQLMDRIAIIFMPAKYQPDYLYLRHVPTRRVHFFTGIQVFCLVVLCTIKMFNKVNIAFPIMVLAMCFIRIGLSRIFSQNELKWLDDIMPEAHKRAKEDENAHEKEEQQLGGQTEGTASDLQSVRVNMENITIAANIDQLNISEEMTRTAMWKSIMHNESSLRSMNNEEETQTVLKQRKTKSQHNIPAEPNVLDRAHNSSPAIIEVEEPKESIVSKKKSHPVRFYIEEPDEPKTRANSSAFPVHGSPTSLSSHSSAEGEDPELVHNTRL